MLRGWLPVVFTRETTWPVAVLTATTRLSPFSVTKSRRPSGESTRWRGELPTPRK